MKRYTKLFLLTVTCSVLMMSCMKSYQGIEQVKTDSTPPERLTVNEIIPKSGALEIHFTLPQRNQNIAQVVASYVNERGKNVEFKVSRYTPSILVEGFTGTDEKAVELVCIDASGNKSKAITVKASPLLSPVELAFSTMKVEPIFGGVKVEWINKDAQPFAIHVLTEDTLQVGVVSLVEDPAKTIYNRDSTHTFGYVRQYPSIEQKFGFSISDKWGNRTDTLLRSVTPYKEELLDRTRIKEATQFRAPLFHINGNQDYATQGVNPATGIQNDGNTHAGSNYWVETMFNGNATTANQYIGYKFIKDANAQNPENRFLQDVYVTLDLNMDVQLSRVVIMPRPHINYTYAASSIKRFRIYGTNDANNERWTKFPEGWTLIGEYEGPEPVNRVSLTQEEITFFNSGMEHLIIDGNVNPDARPATSFRYMRLHWMESYGGAAETGYTVNELVMYGDIERYY